MVGYLLCRKRIELYYYEKFVRPKVLKGIDAGMSMVENEKEKLQEAQCNTLRNEAKLLDLNREYEKMQAFKENAKLLKQNEEHLPVEAMPIDKTVCNFTCVFDSKFEDTEADEHKHATWKIGDRVCASKKHVEYFGRDAFYHRQGNPNYVDKDEWFCGKITGPFTGGFT